MNGDDTRIFEDWLDTYFKELVAPTQLTETGIEMNDLETLVDDQL